MNSPDTNAQAPKHLEYSMLTFELWIHPLVELTWTNLDGIAHFMLPEISNGVVEYYRVTERPKLDDHPQFVTLSLSFGHTRSVTDDRVFTIVNDDDPHILDVISRCDHPTMDDIQQLINSYPREGEGAQRLIYAYARKSYFSAYSEFRILWQWHHPTPIVDTGHDRALSD